MGKRIRDYPRQLKLFDQVKKQYNNVPGSMDIDRQFRALVSEAIKGSPLSRYTIAARMSELCGHEITKSMVDSWSAESKENHRFPAIFIPAFCEAVGSRDALTFLCEKAGTFNMKGPDALRAEKVKRVMFLREMEEE